MVKIFDEKNANKYITESYDTYDFSRIETLMFNMYNNHSSSDLTKLKYEINRFFNKSKCKDVIYTNNTDKVFFGMKVYPSFDGDEALEILGDKKDSIFKNYYVELDSKLFDPMLCLNKKEHTAILLHEIGHIVYDVSTIDEVRKQIDMYFAKSGDYADIKSSRGYKELIAYALKDAVCKAGSLFTKFGNTELVADSFVVGCGYGEALESAMRKLSASSMYLGKDIDNRFIALSWVLRLRSEFSIRRLPAIKTLNKAKELTASELEKRELVYATKILANNDFNMNEGFIDDIRSKFSKKFSEFKSKGVKGIRNDVFELSLRLRTAESAEDLMFIIRQANADIAILQDYITEDISEVEKQLSIETLNKLYDIREKAAEHQNVRDRYDSAIQVIYPDM